MKRTEDKNIYIKARAEGHSIRKAAELAGISTSTGQKWEKTFSCAIEKEKKEELRELSKEYSLTKKGRLEAIGKLLRRLQARVDNIDLAKMPPDKVIWLYLKTLKEASREFVPAASGDVDPGDFESLIRELLSRVIAGDLPPEHAHAETRAVIAAAHIHETKTLEKKVEELAEVLEAVKEEMKELKGSE